MAKYKKMLRFEAEVGRRICNEKGEFEAILEVKEKPNGVKEIFTINTSDRQCRNFRVYELYQGNYLIKNEIRKPIENDLMAKTIFNPEGKELLCFYLN